VKWQIKILATYFFVSVFTGLNAQLVEVQANYNSVGDVDFVAYNNSQAPLFLNIDFADLENTTFNETLPYIKLVVPGFNSLFTLQREPGAEAPRFNYQIKYYRSNPFAIPDLDFPYLIPLEPDRAVTVFDVKDISGFWGSEEPESWVATGFKVTPGETVYSSRNGTVVEVTGQSRNSNSESWYHTWTNTVTILQPDGTLVCYHGIEDKTKQLKPGQKVYAGEPIGSVLPDASSMIMLIWQNRVNSRELLFIIPQFVIDQDKTGILTSSREYTVIHPESVRGLEMTKREKRRYLR
jgi:murein DD-endopeptidase MepM/ murein hydrolase activator NlpD